MTGGRGVWRGIVTLRTPDAEETVEQRRRVNKAARSAATMVYVSNGEWSSKSIINKPQIVYMTMSLASRVSFLLKLK